MKSRQIRNLTIGAGSILKVLPKRGCYNLGKKIINTSNLEAIRGDWMTVGKEIRSAYEKAISELAANGKQE